jgi:hypothetical protein
MNVFNTNVISSKVSDQEKVQKAIADVVNDFGKIDVLIANAGRELDKAKQAT